jgi:DNA repair protein RecN (Recombination protein N)
VLRRSARFAEKKAGPWKEKEWASQLMRASEEIEQVYFEGEQWLSSLEVNTDDLAHAQERLYDYQQLFRKLSVAGVEGLMEKYATLERDIDRLETLEKEVRDQVRACVEGAEALLKADLVLGAQRRESAQRLKGIVEKELKELAIPNAVFGTEFVPAKRTLSELPLFPPALEADGRLLTTRIEACLGSGERVQFLLSSNPGELPLPLNKVASGGELSRVMLALKKTLATEAETCVLVFDEIDTGISGKVADGVGRKLRDLSRQHQVICISHLPQVAVYADEHFLVRKAVQERAVGGKTALRSETQIVRLTEDEIVGEIARLLSGEEISDQSRANARDLRNHARGGIVESSRNLTRYERKKTPTANKKTPKRNVERHR